MFASKKLDSPAQGTDAPPANQWGIKLQAAQFESLEARVERYISMFEITADQRELLAESIKMDVAMCKRHHRNPLEPPGDMKFLDTCVLKPPTGEETGVFYAVDFGGTNIRCVRTVLKGGGELEVDSIVKDAAKDFPTSYPRGLQDANCPASQLFEAIASVVLELMTKYGDESSKRTFPVGFTFSFAMRQFAIDVAEAESMSKGWETGSKTRDPVCADGTDIVLLLNNALNRLKVPAEVVAVLNDTTGTLIAGSYTAPRDYPVSLIGVIIGTGMNICYADPDTRRFGYIGNIINTEMGAYEKNLPRNIIDYEVDDACLPHGKQIMEKMVSGLYLPEICRRAINKVFQEKAPKLTWVHYSLTTKAVLHMAYETDPAFPKTKEILLNQLEWDPEELTGTDVPRICRDLARAVVKRSAMLMAIAISTLAFFTGRLQPSAGGLTVAVDGSLFTKNEGYREDIKEAIRVHLGPDLAPLIKFHVTQDGSGTGASILAADPGNSEKERSFSRTPSNLSRVDTRPHN